MPFVKQFETDRLCGGVCYLMLPEITANESGTYNSYALLQVQYVAVEIKFTETLLSFQ